uniref:transposase n=1 Tax=Arenibacter latericius TaxID=86104 RepID=UPI000A029C65|nr:transposase [Arenibacter latericius]
MKHYGWHPIQLLSLNIQWLDNQQLSGQGEQNGILPDEELQKGGRKELLKLSTHEFVRRFALHVLPKGFTRIRHYGILSSSWKKEKLPALQDMLATEPLKLKEEKPPLLNGICPGCKKGKLVTVLTFDGRGPPDCWKENLISADQP